MVGHCVFAENDLWISIDRIRPGSVVVASTLAAEENRGASGKDLIAAIVVGYEVMSRVGIGVNAVPELAHSLRGFHPAATCVVFGAAAAAGRIFNLTSEEMTNAFEVAGSFASGFGEYRTPGGIDRSIDSFFRMSKYMMPGYYQ